MSDDRINGLLATDSVGRLCIALPCLTSWERMEGDERVRHCAVCNLNVYNRNDF